MEEMKKELHQLRQDTAILLLAFGRLVGCHPADSSTTVTPNSTSTFSFEPTQTNQSNPTSISPQTNGINLEVNIGLGSTSGQTNHELSPNTIESRESNVSIETSAKNEELNVTLQAQDPAKKVNSVDDSQLNMSSPKTLLTHSLDPNLKKSKGRPASAGKLAEKNGFMKSDDLTCSNDSQKKSEGDMQMNSRKDFTNSLNDAQEKMNSDKEKRQLDSFAFVDMKSDPNVGIEQSLDSLEKETKNEVKTSENSVPSVENLFSDLVSDSDSDASL